MHPKLTSLGRRAALARLAAFTALSTTLAGRIAAAQATPPLASWNDTGPRRAIMDFVAAVTTVGSPDFVAPRERVATFDNDGTLWVEQPMYTQLAFALDRVKELEPLYPEWRNRQPFKAALEDDVATLAAGGERGLLELVLATHSGMTTDEFTAIVVRWLSSARHPRFGRPYTELVYQPMIELLAYLRANNFRTLIVSGGGVEFLRPWSERVYGIPPEQVVGSSIRTRFERRDGQPLLFRLPEMNFIDDGAGKPVGIYQQAGQRPIAAVGNSDGDLEMLEWTTMAGDRRRLAVVIHHDDAAREYAYDRQSAFGRLDRTLEAAAIRRWPVVSMKDDWKRIFPFD